MSLITIGSLTPDVSIISLQREATIYEGGNTGRLKNGSMSRDVIGTLYSYGISAEPNGLADYDTLYEQISAPENSYTVQTPFAQGDLEFDAYINKVTDNMLRIKGDAKRWQGLEFTVTPMSPQRYFGESWTLGTGTGTDGQFIVDGVDFDASVVSLERTGEVLETDASGRMKSGAMSREIVGTLYNYQMQIEAKSWAQYDDLYYALTAPVASHTITLPYAQGLMSFTAYVSSVSDKLLRVNNNVCYWGELSVDFIALTPQRT